MPWGYRTGFIGKYGVGRNLPADQFDYWRGIPGQPVYEQKDADGNYVHLTEIMGDQSLEFLRGCSKDQPFCLSVSFKAPNVQDGDPRQFIYDPVYKDLYRGIEISVPETADPAYWESFPEFFTKISLFLSISKMLSFTDNTEAGTPILIRHTLTSPLRAW